MSGNISGSETGKAQAQGGAGERGGLEAEVLAPHFAEHRWGRKLTTSRDLSSVQQVKRSW